MTQSVYTQQAPSSFKLNQIVTFADAPFKDEQALAQTELYNHLETQAQAVAPEELTIVEISFYDHEIYANDRLIAQITYDHNDFVTQPWLVMVNGTEQWRANTWAKCYRYICTHHKDGSLPVQEEETLASTGNEIMVQIFNECEKFGLELLEDGIYRDGLKLGKVGCTEGIWWFVRVGESLVRVPCNSAIDGVCWLSKVKVSHDTPTIDCEELLDRPFDQLTPQDWECLRKYEPTLELVTA